MPLSSSVRSLLLGSKRIPDRRTYKYALLRSQIAILIIAVTVLNIGLDLHHGISVFLPYYAILIGFSGVSLFLTRLGNYAQSTLVLVILVNIVVFVLADVDHPYGGMYFYFISSALLALVLFGYRQRGFGIGFAA
ncbi:MAG: hypothetical protein ACK5XL_04955, partial [Cyclobacteriaceae bacterium]